MSDAVKNALEARRVACAMRPGNPMRYAAWSRVTYLESLLSHDEFDEYATHRQGQGKEPK